jgi:hypothetical protein
MIVFAIFLFFAPSINAYSSGAPCSQIDDLEPGHGSAQNTAAPYWIQLGASCYTPGVSVSVTLTGQQSLRGFVLQARGNCPHNKDSRTGAFNEQSSDFKNQCPDDHSSITHRSSSSKTQIVANWATLDDSFGAVQFVATVVQQYNTFWVQEVKSAVLKPCGDPNASCAKKEQPKPVVAQQNDCSFFTNRHSGADSDCDGWVIYNRNSCTQVNSYVNLNCEKSCCQQLK